MNNRAAMMQRGNFRMQSTNHRRKHVRGSSPREEMQRGFERWVRNLRSIEPAREDPATPPRKIEPRKEQNMELAVHESRAQEQSDAEGRWQDDGGNSG